MIQCAGKNAIIFLLFLKYSIPCVSKTGMMYPNK